MVGGAVQRATVKFWRRQPLGAGRGVWIRGAVTAVGVTGAGGDVASVLAAGGVWLSVDVAGTPEETVAAGAETLPWACALART